MCHNSIISSQSKKQKNKKTALIDLIRTSSIMDKSNQSSGSWVAHMQVRVSARQHNQVMTSGCNLPASRQGTSLSGESQKDLRVSRTDLIHKLILFCLFSSCKSNVLLLSAPNHLTQLPDCLLTVCTWSCGCTPLLQLLFYFYTPALPKGNFNKTRRKNKITKIT